jgi:hypothetical protein
LNALSGKNPSGCWLVQPTNQMSDIRGYWMHSLKKSVKPEIVNRYDLWVLRHKIGGAKVSVNNVQWSDQMM